MAAPLVVGGGSLVKAAAAADWEALRVLLKFQRGCDANEKDPRGYTVLFYVCKLYNASDSKCQDLLPLLVAHGAMINEPCVPCVPPETNDMWAGATPIMVAREPLLVSILLDASADVNACSTYGYSVLMMHVFGVCLKTLPLLLKAGANVNAKTARSQTALQFATCLPSSDSAALDTMKLLISAAADVNAVPRNGQTALHVAAIRNLPDRITILAQAGANLNLRDKQNMTPLMRAARVSLPVTAALVQAGADVKAVDNTDAFAVTKDALVHALLVPCADAAQIALLLVQAGACVTSTIPPNDEDGVPLLAHALTTFHPERAHPLAYALIAAGANVNGSTPQGDTPLMLAAKDGHRSLLEALLDAGADVNASNRVGLTAIFYAVNHGQADAARLLVSRGASLAPNIRGESPLLAACTTQQHSAIKHLNARLHCVQAILSACDNVNHVQGYRALMAAAAGNYCEIVSELIAAGAPPSQPGGAASTSDLIVPCLGCSNRVVVDMLVGAGANINVSGSTALFIAAQSRVDTHVRYLLVLGSAVPTRALVDPTICSVMRHWETGTQESKDPRWHRRKDAIVSWHNYWQLELL
jgi:ankyrin repeat protein